MATSVAHLTELGADLFKRFRFDVFESVFRSTGRALWRLYPEPGATCVENQLMWLMATTKVHGREDLDVEEVG